MMSRNLECVVAAVDGTEESMSALLWALHNLNLKLKPRAGSFVVLHVQPPPSIVSGINPGDIPFGGPSDLEVPAITGALEAHQRRITEAVLDQAMQICSQYNVNVKTVVIVGNPKEKICEAVENLHADLLVMGYRASGRIKRLLHFKKRMFLGSVSNYCMNHAQCPVIIVKDTPKK